MSKPQNRWGPASGIPDNSQLWLATSEEVVDYRIGLPVTDDPKAPIRRLGEPFSHICRDKDSRKAPSVLLPGLGTLEPGGYRADQLELLCTSTKGGDWTRQLPFPVVIEQISQGNGGGGRSSIRMDRLGV